jgi:Uma2 family endonuclease
MTITIQALPRLVTPAEYLVQERRALDKHEYHQGAIIPMTGASRRHNLIAGNIYATLHAQLRRRLCEVYISDMRVRIPATDRYTYPDVAVVCGRPYFEDAEVDTLLNPTVLVEVLSTSTESYDRGEKFQAYRTLDSLADYVLVAQDQVLVEHFVRQSDGFWLFSERRELHQLLPIPAIGCEIAVADIYERVQFDPEE